MEKTKLNNNNKSILRVHSCSLVVKKLICIIFFRVFPCGPWAILILLPSQNESL